MIKKIATQFIMITFLENEKNKVNMFRDVTCSSNLIEII